MQPTPQAMSIYHLSSTTDEFFVHIESEICPRLEAATLEVSVVVVIRDFGIELTVRILSGISRAKNDTILQAYQLI